MTWDWQDWAVALLITVCVIRVAFACRTFFRNTKENKNPCASCATGCALRDQMQKQQHECGNSKPLVQKKVDG